MDSQSFDCVFDIVFVRACPKCNLGNLFFLAIFALHDTIIYICITQHNDRFPKTTLNVFSSITLLERYFSPPSHVKTAVHDKLYEYIYIYTVLHVSRGIQKWRHPKSALYIYMYICKRTRVPSHEQSRATIAIIIAKPDDKLNPSDPRVIIYVCTLAVACTRYPRVLYFAGAVMCSAVACRRSPLRFVLFFFGGEETFLLLLLLLFCTVPATDRPNRLLRGRGYDHRVTRRRRRHCILLRSLQASRATSSPPKCARTYIIMFVWRTRERTIYAIALAHTAVPPYEVDRCTVVPSKRTTSRDRDIKIRPRYSYARRRHTRAVPQISRTE